VAVALVFLSSLGSGVDARMWKSSAGRAFEADFVRMNGALVVFRTGTVESSYPFLLLSPADQQFIRDQLKASPAQASPTQAAAAPPPSSAPLQFGGQPLKQNEENLVELTITDSAIRKILETSYGKKSTKAKVLIAVPPNFAPARTKYPILIVSATTDVGGSSVGAARDYLKDVLGRGFVLIAADGEFGRPDGQGDSTTFRWTLVQAALQEMQKQWPDSKTWLVATAGVSGGGGYASHQAIMLVQKKYPVIGMFLAVSGWNPTSFPEDLKRAPFNAIHHVPVFMSAGESDTIATRSITEEARDAMQRAGFKKMRYEKFPGGHELHHPHLLAALDWFIELNAKPPGSSSH
jgi:hypothetical protein